MRSRTSDAKYTTTNHARGGVRSSSERSHGRRQKNAWRPAGPLFLERGRPVVETAIERSPFDRGPRGDPLLVRDALLASVGARGDWRLPEVDGVEVRPGCVGVVLGAGAW